VNGFVGNAPLVLLIQALSRAGIWEGKRQERDLITPEQLILFSLFEHSFEGRKQDRKPQVASIEVLWYHTG